MCGAVGGGDIVNSYGVVRGVVQRNVRGRGGCNAMREGAWGTAGVSTL